MQHTPRKLSNMSNPEYMYPDHPLAAIVAERNFENLQLLGNLNGCRRKIEQLEAHVLRLNAALKETR